MRCCNARRRFGPVALAVAAVGAGCAGEESQVGVRELSRPTTAAPGPRPDEGAVTRPDSPIKTH